MAKHYAAAGNHLGRARSISAVSPRQQLPPAPILQQNSLSILLFFRSACTRLFSLPAAKRTEHIPTHAHDPLRHVLRQYARGARLLKNGCARSTHLATVTMPLRDPGHAPPKTNADYVIGH